ncbi:class I SAM-dependent methyltransferase [Candidatus Pelagibacter sp.]|nr:class I SAM-dependent methyltransferase [Candidatus Pelagibacter sp.]
MKCRICGSTNLELVFDLGLQPWGNNFLKYDQVGKEKFYPLELLFCKDCHLSQLSFTVKKEIMFADHTYLSGMTSSLSNHFKDLAKYVNQKFNKDNLKKTILDIGSNDGTFLKHFKKLGWEVLGVESSNNISKIANSNQILTLNEFYNLECAKRISKKFDFINASGVFFHLEELHSATKGVKFNLSENGIFIIQFLYMKQIMKNVAFDQIYHEHLVYYNLKTLQNLLSIYNMEIFDAYLADIHGGQMIAFVSHSGSYEISNRLTKLLDEEENNNSNTISTYKNFANQAKELKEKNLNFLNYSLQENKVIFGLGAPVKGNTLINYFGINKKMIPKLLEINSLRKNLFAPGSHIPIIMEEDESQVPDIYYVLAWNFKEEILKKNSKLIDKGIEFYFPIEVNNK